MPSQMHQMHRTLEKDWGKASSLFCYRCGQPAQDWAYQHTAVANEEIDEASGRKWSRDFRDYRPMCRKCHGILDSPNQGKILAWSAAAKSRHADGVRRAGETMAKRMREDPEFAARQAEPFRKLRKCDGCDKVGNAGVIGRHQKHHGHTGWSPA